MIFGSSNLAARLKTPAAVVLLIAALVAVAVTLRSDELGTITADVNEQTWIDTDGTPFQHRLKIGEMDVIGPNGKPAFRAELCFWTADGKSKTQPTPVLLNEHVGRQSPTFCPDCGRLVTPLNRVPPPGVTDSDQMPPPTQAEYAATKASSRN